MGKKVTGADALLLSLIEEGIDTIFGYPGGQIIPVYDKMYDYTDKLRHILARHEQGAIHAAQGYARVSGKTGVTLATSGPGATNLITGLADALMDSTPLVCIVGQVSAHLLGTDAFQEADVIGISTPVTKWNYQITNAQEVPEIIAKAFYIASTGRQGPVMIDFTRNAQIGDCDFEYKKCHFIRSYNPIIEIDNNQIAEAAKFINEADKPFALVGQGVSLAQAETELQQFLEKADIPFGWTLLGKAAMPTQHPLNMGMLGMHGHYATNKKTNECDVLIAIGMRFDDRVTSDLNTYAKQAKIIHLEIDKAEVNKNVKTDAPVLGHLKDSLPLLTKNINKAKHTAWLDSFKPLAQEEFTKVVLPAMQPNEDLPTMVDTVLSINDITKGDAILVTDVGQHQMIAARYFSVNHPRSIVTSGGLGTMGFGLPAAIGAKVGAPDKEVVLFVGDGGIQMSIQELGIILQEQIDIKIVILNNGFLGMVRQWQELFYNKRYTSTPLVSPDFMKIADAYSITAQKVSKKGDLQTAAQTMMTHKGAFLLEVQVKGESNVFPMVPAGMSFDHIRFE
ncbi:MAG: biosynthetic-type acetolactate synthase large subunit [Bacteroidales bacterium]